MSTERAEAIVVGAGIAGAATAFHLAKRGLGPVLGVEARTPAAGATGRAAGIVSEQLWDRWDVEVVRESKVEYAALAARAAPGAYRVNGFLRWTAVERAAAALRPRVEELRAWGVDVSLIPPDRLADLLPAVRTDDLLEVAYAPGDAVVAPSDLAEAYLAEGRRLGVDWRLGLTAGRVVRRGSRWAWEGGGASFEAPSVVIAAGAWSKRLLAEAGHPLPLTPYRTQAATLVPSEAVPGSTPSFDDLDTGIYARPEEQGRFLAGDGTEDVETDPERFPPGGDPEFVAHVAESLGERLPAWADAHLARAWAGVCVSTPDRRPFIGPVPGAEGLHVITGFNGFGVMRAGGAAARLAELLADRGSRARERLRSVEPGRFPGEVRPFPPRDGFTLQAGDAPEY